MTSWRNTITRGDQLYCDERTQRLLNLILDAGYSVDFGGKNGWTKQIFFPDAGMTYFESNKRSISLLQITGAGCEILREREILEPVVSDWNDRLTRIDIALDIKCDAHPEIFARSCQNAKFTSDSHRNTPTGYTWYVGNEKSDRHARVYRYTDHPTRPDYLRVEYELHDAVAKSVGKSYLELGICEVAIQLGATFQWGHPDYRLPTDGAKSKGVSRPSNLGKTEWWIHKAVLPALRKLAKVGKISFLTWLRDEIHGIINEQLYEMETQNGSNTLPNWLEDDQSNSSQNMSISGEISPPMANIHDSTPSRSL
jgi:hypothetical protein